MKLMYTDASPYARKAIIVATELRLLDRFEMEVSPANPLVRDVRIRALNPLGQIPMGLRCSIAA